MLTNFIKKLVITNENVYNIQINKMNVEKSGNKFHSLLMLKGGRHLASIEERVENLILKTIEELGYELYDVQYSKEGKDYFLRIFIDNQKGIDLEDCEKVSDGINDILDTADYIKEQYFLEVSSPGIERILKKDKHLNDSIEKEIEIKLFTPLEGKKEYIGILKEFNNKFVGIEDIITNEKIEIERKNISLIKIKYNW